MRPKALLLVGLLVLALSSAARATDPPPCGAPQFSGGVATVTCAFTGSTQSWTVPAGVTSVDVTLKGGAGAASSGWLDYVPNGSGGNGASLEATIPVTPGSTLYVEVGGAGNGATGGYNGGGNGGTDGNANFPDSGGGGGGASDIRDGTGTLADRILVAAGGGGGGRGVENPLDFPHAGGNGGASGADGATAVDDLAAQGGRGGAKGTDAPGAGGAGGSGGSGGAAVNGNSGADGDAAGGAGGDGASLATGGVPTAGAAGGGGGGGYYGGGGGGEGGRCDANGGVPCGTSGEPAAGGGGGGGSSFISDSATDATLADGQSDADGVVTIQYTPNAGSAPKISSVAPAAALGGAKVTLSGTGLADAAEVDFTGAAHPATIVSNTAKKVVVLVPTDAEAGVITLITANGTAQTRPFRPIPKIVSLDAVDGQAGNTVTITGTNLAPVEGVAFGSQHTASGLTLTPATSLTAVVPSIHFTSGKVSVQTLGGTATSSQTFTITKVTGIAPISAPAGATITIAGAGLGSVSTVDFPGHTGVVPSSVSAAAVKVVVPDDAIPGKLVVNSPHLSGGILTAQTFNAVPTITGVSPLDGQAGTSVTITGKNFYTSVDDTLVFGKVAQPLFNVTSPTQIVTTVPANFSLGTVTFTTPGGKAVSKDSFATTKVTGMSPTSGPAGTVVTITGQGLGSVTAVGFATTIALPFPVLLDGPATPTKIKVILPSVPFLKDGPLTIYTPRIAPTGIQAGSSFKLLPSITPPAAPAQAGGLLIANGSFFEPDGSTAPTVKYGNATLTPLLVSNSSMLVTLPANAVTGVLSVKTANGTATTTVDVVPTIQSGPSPSHGVAGTPVTLTGLTFTGTKSVKFANGVMVPFKLTGTLGATQTLSFKVPTTAASGPITVTNAGGSTATLGSFTVDPQIKSFTPTSAADGATVTLTGTGFGANGDTRVIKVGTVPASSITWVSPTSVKFVVPQGAPTSGPISIAVNGGTAADTGSSLLTVTATLASFSPSSGPAGTSVEIDGAGFSPSSTVQFNGVDATSVTVDSATVIHATVPVGTTPGPITVSRPSAPTTLSSATDFDNTSAVTGIDPGSGHEGDDITVTGTDLTGATTVTFTGGATATASSVTATSLHVTVPTGAETGTITVTTPLGDAVSTATFTMKPTIDGFSPGEGHAGQSVVITGSGFDGATDVSFDGTSAGDGNFSVDSTTQITATVPDGAGTGTITVTTPTGTAESSTSYVVDIAHDNGGGGTYYSPDPLGTYTRQNAVLAARSWLGFNGTINDTACGDFEAAIWVQKDANTYGLWVYGTGAAGETDATGHVIIGNNVFCPTQPTDPTWN